MRYSDYTIVSVLLEAHLNGTITSSQQEQLEEWISLSADNRILFNELNDPGVLQQWMQENEAARKRMYDKLSSAIPDLCDGPREEAKRIVHRVHFLKTAWFKYAAAIIILCGIGAYLWKTQNNSSTITQTQPVPLEKDILPGGQKATLTLADGSTIILDSVANGQLAVQNGSEVIKKDGQVIYDMGQVRSNSITYNTMSTPKGGQYQLTLTDGTKVWLNAASRITYPTVFNGNTREVNITGEAYFVVAKNKAQPFIVKTIHEKITVLGTSFNVNSYNDEPGEKISLIEGSVKVNNNILQPGQAYISGKIITTNIQQDIAWKNGLFYFSDADLPTVLRQVERWYDIEVQYPGKIPPIHFNGELQRSLHLSEILEVLRESHVRFTLRGKTLFVQ